ncbi:hypothetical protein [Streptomyces sp. NPDC046909]|uniref:hypothetical protein n=1 Tax=Streptomyces sp. NPDC046909 TaxID=3155617 RepID=UPI003404A43A
MTGSPVLLAVALSLVSAVCYAAAAVVQERTAAGTTSVRGALARGAWWGSVLLNASGALLHVVALRYGPLTLVQPLGALSLVLAVPLGSLVTGRRTSGAQWRGMAFTVVGLSTLLAVTASGTGPAETLSTPEVLTVALVAGAVIAALATRTGLAVAAASGIASGVGSTLAQKLVIGPTVSWDAALLTLLTVAFAVGGLLLSQKAYGNGLGAPLATLTLLNPVTASAIGIALLGEGFQYGATGTLLALAGAAAAVRGVLLLSGPRPDEATATAPVHPLAIDEVPPTLPVRPPVIDEMPSRLPVRPVRTESLPSGPRTEPSGPRTAEMPPTVPVQPVRKAPLRPLTVATVSVELTGASRAL